MTITADLLETIRVDVQRLGDQLDEARRQRDDARLDLTRLRGKLAMIRADLEVIINDGEASQEHLMHAWGVLVDEPLTVRYGYEKGKPCVGAL